MSAEASKYWAKLEAAAESFGPEALAEFRSGGGVNDRFAGWNPRTRGMTYFKFFLFHLLQKQPPAFFTAYAALGRTDLGNPPYIVSNDGGRRLKIDYEYFMAVDELLFLSAALDGASLKNVCEVGAGFGRTCHCLLRNLPGIATYTIIDLPNIMRYSQIYLKEVLAPQEYARVRFVDALGMKQAPGDFDLALSSNSLQSMPVDIVEGYLAMFAGHAKYFYVRDAVAKYRPEELLGEAAPADPANAVFQLGLCRDVIDVFDIAQLEQARAKYNAAYKPSAAFDLAASKPVEAIPFYQHALYRKRG